MQYPKSQKYTDLKTIYAQCSGPGGLKLTEFIAEKMGIKAGKKLVDIGVYRGYQTCFLAKEFGANIIGIDPWDDIREIPSDRSVVFEGEASRPSTFCCPKTVRTASCCP